MIKINYETVLYTAAIVTVLFVWLVNHLVSNKKK